MIVNKKVIACYIRLSEDDKDTAKGLKDESNSVSAQRNLIRGYIGRFEEFKEYDITEYVDDGYTGTTFTRPGYEKMMEAAKRGDIGIIIVKDFSRLGRDHLETGELLERIFPILEIRFISVNDNYDSADCEGMTGGLTVALKNVMNAMYSKDLSCKVRSAMNTRAKNGQYMSSKVPFGYMKDPEDIHHLVIDEEAADVVRTIFTFASEGKNKGWIKGYLNAHSIPTPSEYLISHGRVPNKPRNAENPQWTVTTIGDMLRNQVYIGNTCWGKSAQNISTGRKNVKTKRDEWIVARGTHEAIVSKELFDKANELAFNGKHNISTGKVCPLIFCGCCGRSMSTPKDGNHTRYRCMNGYGEFADEGCRKNRIKMKSLEQAVLANVNVMADIYADKKAKITATKSEAATIEERIGNLKKEQAHLRSSKTRLYEEYRLGGCRETYIQKKNRTDERLEEIVAEIQEAECRLEAVKLDELHESETEQALSEVKTLETFDREILKKVIDRVNVYGQNEIEIIWKPMDAIFKSITESKVIEV